jgi:hypothetical protein
VVSASDGLACMHRSWGFPALRHLTPANWRTLACIHRGARPFEKPRHMFGFLGPCSCLAGVPGEEFASGAGRGGSMVSGRGADLDRDAESAIHGHAQAVTFLLRRRPSLAASEGEPLSSSAESFRRAADTPRRGQTRAHSWAPPPRRGSGPMRKLRTINCALSMSKVSLVSKRGVILLGNEGVHSSMGRRTSGAHLKRVPRYDTSTIRCCT